MTSKFTKMTRSEYRWKILIPTSYGNGLDGSPTLKGEWIISKRECYKDFLKKNSEIDGDREAYLYKRMILPDHFLIFGKSKYHEYKYKIKASFHREEDLWTLYESKWDRKLKQTLSDLKTLRKRGYDYVCCCEPIEYLYMRRPFPIENLPPFETEMHYPHDMMMKMMMKNLVKREERWIKKPRNPWNLMKMGIATRCPTSKTIDICGIFF